MTACYALLQSQIINTIFLRKKKISEKNLDIISETILCVPDLI